MSYSAYETASGEAMLEVASLCRHAARSTGAFATTTIPTLAAVERFLTNSRSWIVGMLRANSLSETQTDADVLGILQELNVYDVCVRVELSLPQEGGTGNENERFKAFKERRDELLEMLKDGTLAAMGAAEQASGSRTPIITGLSKSRKDLLDQDTDATQHRVKRDMFQSPFVTLSTGEEMQQ